MCGILGFFSKKYNAKTFKKSLEMLSHRGPYGEGFVNIANGSLGMVRLPMSSNLPEPIPLKIGHYIASFNGEVYKQGNHICNEVMSLINGINDYQLPDGMYAIAFWNEINKELVLYRDRFGIKPLYYAYNKEYEFLAFSSEIEPLMNILKNIYFNKINYAAIAQIISTGVTLDYSTLIKDIKILPPNTKLTFQYDGIRFIFKEKMIIKNTKHTTILSLEAMINESLDLCNQSFREKALLISSGIDSNILSSYLDSEFKRFNLCMPETIDSPIATDCPIQKVNFEENMFMETFRKAVKAFGSASRMTSLLMYQKLAEAIKKSGYHCVLVGEGADESFWGYPRHIKLWDSKGNISPINFAKMWFGNYEKNSTLLSHEKQYDLNNKVLALAKNSLKDGFVSAIEKFDLDYSLEPLLRRTDHILMRETIEARTPFLHNNIPFSTLAEYRIQNGLGKYDLHQLACKRTNNIFNNKKRHFRAPLIFWENAKKDLYIKINKGIPFLQHVGLENITSDEIKKLDVMQLFNLTSLVIWNEEYGKYI